MSMARSLMLQDSRPRLRPRLGSSRPDKRREADWQFVRVVLMIWAAWSAQAHAEHGKIQTVFQIKYVSTHAVDFAVWEKRGDLLLAPLQIRKHPL